MGVTGVLHGVFLSHVPLSFDGVNARLASSKNQDGRGRTAQRREGALFNKSSPRLVVHELHKADLEVRWIRRHLRTTALLSSISSPQSVDGDPDVDVVILSNGPGEVATWVKPVLDSLRRRQTPRVRISVVLQPCPHSSGKERELVESFNQVDRCLGPESFWNLVLFGLTEEGWTWSKRGVCIFLGGDQFYTVLLSQRLKYKSVLYSEDCVRWPGLVDMYMLRSAQLLITVPFWAHSKCKVVGDLFSDSVISRPRQNTESCNSKKAVTPEASVPVVGFLPGSKDRMMGRVRLLLPLAPTASVEMLEKYANEFENPNIGRFGWASGKVSNTNCSEGNHGHDKRTLEGMQCQPFSEKDLITDEGVHIEIVQQFPAYDVFRQCCLCITTIGTNTAELGYLGIPMLVVLPTHALEIFKGATRGFPGLVSNIPGGVGDSIARTVNSSLLQTSGYVAWPNRFVPTYLDQVKRWVGREVVPELVGRIEPVEVGNVAAYYLKNEERLDEMRDQLITIQSRQKESLVSEHECRNGAAEYVADEVFKLLRY